MSTLQELLAQQAALAKQIEELRNVERKDAIEQALALIKDYQLTQQDLFGGVTTAVKVKKSTTKGVPMYRDPATQAEWTGHGRHPKWVRESGKDKSEFLIEKIVES